MIPPWCLSFADSLRAAPTIVVATILSGNLSRLQILELARTELEEVIPSELYVPNLFVAALKSDFNE
jgi:hypothetical protein